ncbi:hypothetical protein BDAP_001654 [Binucleata daphniae]
MTVNTKRNHTAKKNKNKISKKNGDEQTNVNDTKHDGTKDITEKQKVNNNKVSKQDAKVNKPNNDNSIENNNILLQPQNDKKLPEFVKNVVKRYFKKEECSKIEYLLFYNTQGGKNSRSKIFEILLKEINGKRSAILMFIIELLQASFVVFDDVMDNSEMRRGTKCWYLQKDITAIADAMLIINLIYKIVLDPECELFDQEVTKDEKSDNATNTKENTYDNKKQYLKYEIVRFINYVILKSCIGQTIDAFKFETKTHEDIKKCVTMQNYKEICDGKNGCYTFYFPLKLAFICAQTKEPVNLEKACNAMGLLHQMRDDYLNFYPEQTGKTGNDLEEKKLTYFICKLVESDVNLVSFFNSNEIEPARKEIQKHLDCFDEDQKKIVETIKSLKEKETEKIIETCIDFLVKRNK